MSVAGHPTFTCGTSADIYVWQFTCGTSLRLRRAWESLETFATPPTPIATALGRATLLAHPSPILPILLILTHTHSYSLILTHTHSYSLILTHTHSYYSSISSRFASFETNPICLARSDSSFSAFWPTVPKWIVQSLTYRSTCCINTSSSNS